MKLFCPLCEQEQEVTNISSTVVNIRGEDIVVPVKMYKCSVCGEIFDDVANPQDELAKAYFEKIRIKLQKQELSDFHPIVQSFEVFVEDL